MANPIRMKEATAQITEGGVRVAGSFTTMRDVSLRPDVDIVQRQYTGDKRQRADLNVKGYGFSFKLHKTDHLWWAVWKRFEIAERNGDPFPVLSLAVTGKYRDGTGQTKTITLHGDLVMKPDEDNIGSDGGSYQEVTWSGYCSEASGI